LIPSACGRLSLPHSQTLVQKILDGPRATHTLQAAQMLAQAPQAMQLRYLQTLTAIASDKSSTIIFPMPMDLINSTANRVKRPTQN
jgi:regulator of protease activity HflC (stomatin/prohibitin superfamily)